MEMIDRMKKSLSWRIRKLLYYLGFTVERIPDEDQLFAELHTAYDAIQKYKLKKRALRDRIHNNHKRYSILLKRFVSDWDIAFKSTEFIGQGSGKHNLCVYRKVCIDNKYYFEKVYFNDSVALRKNMWIQDNGYPILRNYLNTAKLCKIIRGDLISIAYFDFIDFVHLPREEQNTVMFSASKKMFNISLYFYLIFTVIHEKNASTITLQKDVFRRIEELYRNKVNT